MADEVIDLAAAEAAAFGDPSRGRRATSCEACRKAKRKCTHITMPSESGPAASGSSPRVVAEVGAARGHESRPPARPRKATSLDDAVQSLQHTMQGAWDIMAEIWDDPDLRVPDDEARPWALSTARALDQLGLAHHTQKLAPAEAIARSAHIILPRAKRIMLTRTPTPPPGGPIPAFRRPGSSPGDADRAVRASSPVPVAEPAEAPATGGFPPTSNYWGANIDRPHRIIDGLDTEPLV